MAAPDALEVERKYSVDQNTELPQLGELPGVDRTGEPVRLDLDAVYYDTAAFDLAAHGITLRRRTGGTDAGWHLKLPVRPGVRSELAEPLGTADVIPDRFRDLVAVHVRNQLLAPVAKLTTHRTTTPLLAPEGAVLAEFSDDRVESEAPIGEGLLKSWREWEIELAAGDEDLLAAADELLAAAGVRPARLQSKLARALGPLHPGKPPRLIPTPKGRAGTVLLAYLQQEADAFKAMDPQVRQDTDDAVHQLRVSARRMRSALATYRKLTDATVANHLRDELKWVAVEVGRARDVEVMRDRLTAMARAEPPELLMGPVLQRIEEETAGRYRDAHAAGLQALSSERYFAFLDALDAFLADPPLTEKATTMARGTARKLVDRDIRRVRKAVRAAEEAADADEPTLDAALHEVRKSAKRLRYAAEASRPVLGKRAKRLAKAAERIQETLGALQDNVVSRALLRELAVEAYAEGANAFSFGRLHALEQQRAAEARAQFTQMWTELRSTLLKRP